MTNRLQTFGALAFALIAVSVSATVTYRTLSPERRVLIPTLGESFTGQVAPGTPVREYSPEEGMAGIVLEKDTHNFFTCPQNVNRIEIEGSPVGDTRYWIYEFTGTEPPFNGAFYVSPAELAANPQFEAINTLKVLVGGKRYYLMTERDLHFRCGVHPAFRAKYCGDDECSADLGETAETCHADCGRCGDGQVSGNEQCDSVAHCTAECKPETGYKCENNECTPLIPELPGDDDDEFIACDGGAICNKAVNANSCQDLAIDCRGPDGGFVAPEPTGKECGNAACAGKCFKCPSFSSHPSSSSSSSSSNNSEDDVVPSIELHTATIDGDSITILYSKNFATCAHIYKRTGKIDQRINFICGEGTKQTAKADMNQFGEKLVIGDTIKICHGNDGNICSDFVTIQGQSSGDVGNLFVAKDSTPLRSRQMLGGTLTEPILRLSFRAEGEDIDVTDIRLLVDGGPARSVDRLELYFEGETVPFDIATIGKCGDLGVASPAQPMFCSHMPSQQLVVENGFDKDAIVRPRMKNDEQGAVSGERITLRLPGRGIEGIIALGMNSGKPLTQNNGDDVAKGEIFVGANIGENIDIVGNPNVVTLSKIARITALNLDADGSSVPTGFATIAQLRIAADQNTNTKNGINDVILSNITFDVEANNVALNANDFSLYNMSGNSKAQCKPHYQTDEPFTSDYISGVFIVKCNLRTSNVNGEINAGQNERFALDANVILTHINGAEPSSLQAKLTKFDTINGSYEEGTSHIRWNDTDQGGSVQFDWVEYPETVIKFTLYKS